MPENTQTNMNSTTVGLGELTLDPRAGQPTLLGHAIHQAPKSGIFLKLGARDVQARSVFWGPLVGTVLRTVRRFHACAGALGGG